MIVIVSNTFKLRASSQVSDDVESDEFQPPHHVNVDVALNHALKLIHKLVNMTSNQRFLTAKCFFENAGEMALHCRAWSPSGAVKRLWISGRRRA